MMEMKLRSLVVIMLVAVLTLVIAAPAFADAPAATAWLKTQQRADGGFGMEKSTLSETAEVVLSLAASGVDVKTVNTQGKTPLDFLAANIASATNTGNRAKVALAVTAAGGNPYDFGGQNLITLIKGTPYSTGQLGTAEDSVSGHAYAMLALASVNELPWEPAVNWLLAQQNPDGGWAWNGSQKAGEADTNTTALVVQALLANGVSKDNAAIQKAVTYLRGTQNDDGGFPYQKPSPYGTDTDANSTANVLQAIAALSDTPSNWASKTGKTPLDALQSLQNASGAFAWQAAMPSDNLLATAQAAPALFGKAYPYVRVSLAATVVATATPALVQTAATSAPVQVLPQSGGNTVSPIVLIGAGTSFILAGYLLRRRIAA